MSGASAMRRLTFGGRNKFPIWSGDGVRVAFQSDREGDQGIFSQPADGTGPPERLTKPAQGASHVAESWSPNGEWLLFSETKGARVALMLFSLKDRKAVPFGGVEATTFTSAAFSPDGRWVTYSGRGIIGDGSAVFVQPFPPTGAPYQVTKDPTAIMRCGHPTGRNCRTFGRGAGSRPSASRCSRVSHSIRRRPCLRQEPGAAQLFREITTSLATASSSSVSSLRARRRAERPPRRFRSSSTGSKS